MTGRTEPDSNNDDPAARRAEVDALADSLCRGADDGLRALFEAAGSRGPVLRWSPAESDLQNPIVRRFHALCRALRDAEGRVPAAAFRMDAFAGLHDWMMLIDVEAGGARFRYRHYGDAIAEIRGMSMTGRTTEGFGGHISTFFAAVYTAALTRRDWVQTIHEPPGAIFARNWERLIVPLAGATGEIVQFAVANVADNELRPGLEIIPDPVLIVDAGQVVRYANRAAREMFGRQIYQGSELDLFAFSGIDLDPPDRPEALLRAGTVRDAISLAIRGTMIERFHLTLSATEQWGTAYYVITLRPAIPSPG